MPRAPPALQQTPATTDEGNQENARRPEEDLSGETDSALQQERGPEPSKGLGSPGSPPPGGARKRRPGVRGGVGGAAGRLYWGDPGPHAQAGGEDPGRLGSCCAGSAGRRGGSCGEGGGAAGRRGRYLAVHTHPATVQGVLTQAGRTAQLVLPCRGVDDLDGRVAHRPVDAKVGRLPRLPRFRVADAWSGETRVTRSPGRAQRCVRPRRTHPCPVPPAAAQERP